MIISIRGTHGSGKSTTVKKLVELYTTREIFGPAVKKRPQAYELQVPGVDKPVFIIGPYQLACGGCDAVQPYDLILDLIKEYGQLGHVVFEGALVSSSYGRIGTLMEQWGEDSVFAFLPTPLEECLNRIRARREARGDTRPLNPKNTEGKFRSVQSSRKQVAAKGIISAVDLDWHDPVQSVMILLREGADGYVRTMGAGPGRTADTESCRAGAMDAGSDSREVSVL